MNHQELTNDLFSKHFPEWLNEAHVEDMMKRTIEAFEKRGVPAFYHSLHPQAKRDRWERRQEKIAAHKSDSGNKNHLQEKTVKKILGKDLQPSLFD